MPPKKKHARRPRLRLGDAIEALSRNGSGGGNVNGMPRRVGYSFSRRRSSELPRLENALMETKASQILRAALAVRCISLTNDTLKVPNRATHTAVLTRN